jgi:zinc transporter 1/2/3
VSLVVYKIIASLVIFVISLAMIYPLRKKHISKHTESIDLAEALASGLFLGAAFFHLLPDAIQSFQAVYGNGAYPVPEAVCIGSFLLFLFLERFSLIHSYQYSISYVVWMILVIHAVVEGMALGMGSTFSETILLLIAIIAHKGSESFALGIILLKNQMPIKQVTRAIFYFALMTPLGIVAGSTLNELGSSSYGSITSAVFNAFAAGTFLYISTLHHIHFHQHTKEKNSMLSFLCFVIGLASMGILAIWV